MTSSLWNVKNKRRFQKQKILHCIPVTHVYMGTRRQGLWRQLLPWRRKNVILYPNKLHTATPSTKHRAGAGKWKMTEYKELEEQVPPGESSVGAHVCITNEQAMHSATH